MSYTATVSLSDDLIEGWKEIPAMERSKLVQRLLREEFSGSTTKVNKLLTNSKAIEKVDKSKPEINLMFEQWATITGVPINGQQKANRNACSNLLKKHGVAGVQRLIQGVAKAQGQEFAPQIANFVQLQTKLDTLILWGRKQSNQESAKKGPQF